MKPISQADAQSQWEKAQEDREEARELLASVAHRFAHDCKACKFLGQHFNDEGRHDLYICLDVPHGWHTVIARYGSEGSEYRSFSVDSNVLDLFKRKPEYVLAVAYRMAKEQGFTFKEDKS